MNNTALLSSFIDLKSRVESFQTEIDSINQFINQAAQALKELNARTDLPAELHDIKISFEDHCKKELSAKTSLNSVIQEMKALLISHGKDIAIVLQELEIGKNRISEVEKKFDLLNSSIINRNASIWNDVNNKIYDMTNAYNKLLHSFKEELCASPKSILDTNTEILKKFEALMSENASVTKKINLLDFNFRKYKREVDSNLEYSQQ